MATHSPARLLLGLILMGVGALLSADAHFGLIDSSRILGLWPGGLVLLGGVKLLRVPRHGGWATAALLIVAGVWLFARQLGLTPWRWELLQPVLLFFAGAIFIVGGLTGGRPFMATAVDRGELVEGLAVMGGLDRQCASDAFEGGELVAIMGAVEVDLRQAEMSGAVARIDALAFWGGVEIKVPLEWEVVVRGLPLMGSVEDKTRRPSGEVRGRLVVRGLAIMGGLEVVN